MCDDFIKNRYIIGREDAANGLLEILIENIDNFKFQKDWLFPDISLTDWKDLQKPKNNHLKIENMHPTEPKGGNTWDNLFRTKNKGRTADAVFKSKEGLIIIENKKSKTGFYIQQLLYYYLYCLYNYDLYKKFYLINTVINTVNDESNIINIHHENEHLKKEEFIKGEEIPQFSKIIIDAIRAMESILKQTDSGGQRNVESSLIDRNKDIFNKNFDKIRIKTENLIKGEIEIVNKSNSNIGKFAIEYPDKSKKDEKVEMEWLIVPWSEIKWGEMEQAINNNKTRRWHEIIQKELFLLSEYYNKSSP